MPGRRGRSRAGGTPHRTIAKRNRENATVRRDTVTRKKRPSSLGRFVGNRKPAAGPGLRAGALPAATARHRFDGLQRPAGRLDAVGACSARRSAGGRVCAGLWGKARRERESSSGVTRPWPPVSPPRLRRRAFRWSAWVLSIGIPARADRLARATADRTRPVPPSPRRLRVRRPRPVSLCEPSVNPWGATGDTTRFRSKPAGQASCFPARLPNTQAGRKGTPGKAAGYAAYHFVLAATGQESPVAPLGVIQVTGGE